MSQEGEFLLRAIACVKVAWDAGLGLKYRPLGPQTTCATSLTPSAAHTRWMVSKRGRAPGRSAL